MNPPSPLLGQRRASQASRLEKPNRSPGIRKARRPLGFLSCELQPRPGRVHLPRHWRPRAALAASINSALQPGDNQPETVADKPDVSISPPRFRHATAPCPKCCMAESFKCSHWRYKNELATHQTSHYTNTPGGVRKNVFKQNDMVARELRQPFHDAGVYVVSLVSSPGSGKTAFLEKTLALLRPNYRVAALVGDLATENDAARLARRTTLAPRQYRRKMDTPDCPHSRRRENPTG